jgi:hypothetical protein
MKRGRNGGKWKREMEEGNVRYCPKLPDHPRLN